MRFFFDRNTSPRIARMLDTFDRDHTIRHHDDDERFDPTTPDNVWISALGGDDTNWIIVSGDGRILRNRVERKLIETTGARFFYLATSWMRMKFPELAWRMIKLWPEVVEAAANVRDKIFEIEGRRLLKIRRVD